MKLTSNQQEMMAYLKYDNLGDYAADQLAQYYNTVLQTGLTPTAASPNSRWYSITPVRTLKHSKNTINLSGNSQNLTNLPYIGIQMTKHTINNITRYTAQVWRYQANYINGAGHTVSLGQPVYETTARTYTGIIKMMNKIKAEVERQVIIAEYY